MLKLNTKLKLPLILSVLGISGIFLFQYLTYVPEYSNAAPISTDTPVIVTPTTPLAKWSDLQYMQQMTPQACADAKVGDSKTLTDNTAGSNSEKTYTVQKMQIGNECWMTENMDNEFGRSYRHFIYGGYYRQGNANAVCAKMGDGWELPSRTQYQNIANKYTTGTTLAASPYRFLYGGIYTSVLESSGASGNYLSSTFDPNSGSCHFSFSSDGGGTSCRNELYGFSVRCVAKTTSDVTPVDPSAGGNTGINDPNVSVIVPNMITLDVSDSVDIATEMDRVNTGEFTAIVKSNSDYTISLNAAAEGADATSLVNYKDGNKVGEIPTITENSQPQPGISSWGIMLCNNTTKESCTNNYLPLPKKDATNSTFLNNETKGTHQHLFQIGIGIGPELPSGTYSTSIQVTASQK